MSIKSALDYRKIFEMIDLNRDGYVDLKELRKGYGEIL